MFINKREYVKPFINGVGLTAGNEYLVIDGGFSGNGAYIQDDDGINHYLSDEFMVNHCECKYKYVIHEGRKVAETECDCIRIDKRLINKYIIDSLFNSFEGTLDEKSALKRIMEEIEAANILNWSMSKYAEKVYRQLKTEE
jgi:hemerythrin superfamily protein